MLRVSYKGVPCRDGYFSSYGTLALAKQQNTAKATLTTSPITQRETAKW